MVKINIFVEKVLFFETVHVIFETVHGYYTTNCSSSVLSTNHINHVVPFSISKESIVDIEGTVQAAEQKIQSCSQSDVEIVVTKVQLSLLCYFVFVFCENTTRELRGF